MSSICTTARNGRPACRSCQGVDRLSLTLRRSAPEAIEDGEEVARLGPPCVIRVDLRIGDDPILSNRDDQTDDAGHLVRSVGPRRAPGPEASNAAFGGRFGAGEMAATTRSGQQA